VLAAADLSILSLSIFLSQLERSLNSVLPDAEKEFLQEVIRINTPALQAIHEATRKVSFQGVAVSDRKKEVEASHDRVEDLRANILLYAKGTELFEDDEKAQLQKHLVKSLCAQWMDHIIVHQYLLNLERESATEKDIKLDM